VQEHGSSEVGLGRHGATACQDSRLLSCRWERALLKKGRLELPVPAARQKLSSCIYMLKGSKQR